MPDTERRQPPDGAPRHAGLDDDAPGGARATRMPMPIIALWAVIIGGVLVIGTTALRSHGSPLRGDSPTAIPTPVPTLVRGGVGDVLDVGELRLQVDAVNGGFDAKRYSEGNTATYAVKVSVRNAATGGTVTFVPSAFRLVDSSGDVSGIAACMGCPARYTVSLKLAPGAGASGWVYFLLRAGRSADRVTYEVPGQHILASIALR